MIRPGPLVPEPAPLPTSLAEREEVIDALCIHFANGSLTMPELERRLEQAFHTRSSDELRSLLSDLPPLSPEGSDAGAPPQLVPSSSVPPRGMLIAVLGSSERTGGWTVPRHLKVYFAAGGVSLDLRSARLGPGVTEIEVSGVAGAAEIIVPPGIRVEVMGAAFMGAFSANAGDPGPPHADQPLLRISGFVTFGGVEVTLKAPKTKVLRRFEKATRAARKLSGSDGTGALPPR